MTYGRKSGFLVAAGVITGAITWGVLAALGVSALLAAVPNAIIFIQIFGGIYLSFLGYRSFYRMVLKPEIAARAIGGQKRLYYLKGYTVHMSNPEAMMGWIAIITLGLTDQAPAFASVYIVSGCIMIALVVYNCYAYFFSNEKIASLYQSWRQFVDGIFGCIFAYVGVTLLLAAL